MTKERLRSTMQAYEFRSLDIVKSVRQCWLLRYWLRLRGERPLPLWAELDMAELDSCFDDLTILDVLAENGAYRLRIFDHGKNVGAMFMDRPAGRCAGKYLEETLPETARARTLESYDQAVRSRLPVYTVSKALDRESRPVIYERLLLPFSDSGARVFRIVGFLETISFEGAFERRKLMRGEDAAGAFQLKALIQARP